MLAAFAVSLAIAQAAAPAAAQPAIDGPMVTAAPAAARETAEALRRREAMAYAWPLNPGVPSDDFRFLAWCVGAISGHAALGDTVPNEDAELLRLAKLERSDFMDAYAIGSARRSADEREAAEAVRVAARQPAQPHIDNPDAAARAVAFNSFAGLPGRCEHAARRVRENITTAVPTLAQVGLTVEQVVPPEVIERAAAANAPAPAPVPADPSAPMVTAVPGGAVPASTASAPANASTSRLNAGPANPTPSPTTTTPR